MDLKKVVAVVAGIAAVSIGVYFIATQPAEVELIHGAGLQNADKCTKGDFTADPSKDTVEITIDAYQWRFNYCSITVYEGQRMHITLQSLDVPHGFAIDGYPELGSKNISPGAETVFEFTANKVGEFTFYCTVFCGEGHPLHQGELIVQSM